MKLHNFIFAIVLLIVANAATGEIVINNNDGSSEGFNDPTPVTPVGGNAAITLGQARLNLFRHASLMLEEMINITVPVQVDAKMESLGGDANSAVLGGASPTIGAINFSGAPLADTWYVIALANTLSGSDLAPGVDDITTTFNSDVDGDVVLGSTRWYYGFDNSANTDIKFLPTVQHEIVHGLGFLTFMNASGVLLNDFQDAYVRHLEDHNTPPYKLTEMTDAQRAAALIEDGALHWVGDNVRAASSNLVDGTFGDHVLMYAPNPYADGSSVSHFDISVRPSDLMEPFLTSNPDTIMTAALLEDLGWTVLTHTPSQPAANIAATAQIAGISNQTFSLGVTAINTDTENVPHASIEFPVPSNITLTNVSPTTGSCTTHDSLLRCNLGTLAATTSVVALTLDATINDNQQTTLGFNLSSPLFDNDVSNNLAELTLNPQPVIPDISVANAMATEGDPGDNTQLSFTINLSTATALDVDVDYMTSENSAVSGLDYLQVSGTLTIPAGSTSGLVSVPLIPDNEIEPNETLTLTLSNPVNGTIVSANATGTIVDDDAPSSSASGGGGGGSMGLFLLALLLALVYRHRSTIKKHAQSYAANASRNETSS